MDKRLEKRVIASPLCLLIAGFSVQDLKLCCYAIATRCLETEDKRKRGKSTRIYTVTGRRHYGQSSENQQLGHPELTLSFCLVSL